MPESASAGALEDLVLVGVSARGASPRLRERLAEQVPDLETVFRHLKAIEVEEALVIATCERLEIMTIGPGPAPGVLRRIVATCAPHASEEVARQCFLLEGSAALKHLFAVAASLDSRIVGDAGIIGQLRDCHRRAAAAGLVGNRLERMLQAGYAAARRVRSESALAERPRSVTGIALELAHGVHGDIGRCNTLLVGLGEMGEMMADELMSRGAGRLTVLHPSLRRAEDAASRLHCHFRPWTELPAALGEADIVISDHGSGEYTITEESVKLALKRRRHRPMVFFDLSVPEDLEAAVGGLEDAFAFAYRDLERIAGETNAAVSAPEQGWRIVEEEVDGYLRKVEAQRIVPSIRALRTYFEEVREEVLREGSATDPERLTELLIRRLLHGPCRRLEEAAAGSPEEMDELDRLVRRLFPLDRNVGKDDGQEG